MSNLSDTEFVLQVAREVVSEIAPEELQSFALTAEAYELNPESLRARKASEDVELGMGVGEVITTWAPTIVLLLHQAVLQGGKDAMADGAKAVFTGTFERIRRLMQGKDKKQTTSLPVRGQELSHEDMKALYTFFHETALEDGVKDPDAQKIAERLVGKWVIWTVNKGGQ